MLVSCLYIPHRMIQYHTTPLPVLVHTGMIPQTNWKRKEVVLNQSPFLRFIFHSAVTLILLFWRLLMLLQTLFRPSVQTKLASVETFLSIVLQLLIASSVEVYRGMISKILQFYHSQYLESYLFLATPPPAGTRKRKRVRRKPQAARWNTQNTT